MASMQVSNDAASTPLRIRIRGLSDEGGPAGVPSPAQKLEAGVDSGPALQPGNGPAGPIRPITSPMHTGQLPESLWESDHDLSMEASLQPQRAVQGPRPPKAPPARADLTDEAFALIQRASEGHEQAAGLTGQSLDAPEAAVSTLSPELHDPSESIGAAMEGPAGNEVAASASKTEQAQGSHNSSVADAIGQSRVALTFGSSDGSSAESQVPS